MTKRIRWPELPLCRPPPSLPARHEPVEQHHLVNDALDLIERHVRVVLENGGELALATRLRRLAPELFECGHRKPDADDAQA